MIWKLKNTVKNTEWYEVFAWLPVKTEENSIIWLEHVYKRYKIHMSGGHYIYKQK